MSNKSAIRQNRDNILTECGKRIRADLGEGTLTEKQLQQWYKENRVFVSKTGLKHMFRYLNKINESENV